MPRQPEGPQGAARHSSQCPHSPWGLCQTPGIMGGWHTLSLPHSGPRISLEVWDEQQPEGSLSLGVLLSPGSVWVPPCSRTAFPALLLHEVARRWQVTSSVTVTSHLHPAQDGLQG